MRLPGRSAASLAILALLLVACAKPAATTDSSQLDAAATETSMPMPDRSVLPLAEEVSLQGTVDAELDLRDQVRESAGIAEVLGADDPGALERVDEDMAGLGWIGAHRLADEAGFDPITSSSGLVVGLGIMPGEMVSDWGGSMEALSGNFTVSMFLALMLRDWQHMADSELQRGGDFANEAHDREVNGVAEHSEMRITVDVTAEGAELHFEIQVAGKATLTEVATGKQIGSYESQGRGLIEANGCPEADGTAQGHYTLELQEEASGAGASAGGSVLIDGPFTVINGDDARLIRTDVSGHFDSAAHGTTPSGEPFSWTVNSTYPISIPAHGSPDFDSANGTYGESGGAGDRGIQATSSAMAMTAEFLSGVAQESEKFWRSGRCVELTTSEESRKVGPSEQLSIETTAKHRFDGSEVDAPVTTSLSGPDRIEPADVPQDPPATLTYTAGSGSGDKGTITLDQKSKRGIGKKTLEFEVEPQAIHVVYAGSYRFVDALSDLRWEADIPIKDGHGEVEAPLTLSGNTLLLTLCPTAADLEVLVKVTVTVDVADPELFRLTMAPPPPPELDLASCAAAAQMEAGIAMSGWAAGLQRPQSVHLGETMSPNQPGAGATAQITVTKANS